MATPRKEYTDQKHHAAERGIDFILSYEEWLEMWLLSGKYSSRGRNKGDYVMARIGDKGSYSVRNCYICTVEENSKTLTDRVEKIDNSGATHLIDLYLNTRLTQYEIASMFGISQSHVSRVVNGLRRVNL